MRFCNETGFGIRVAEPHKDGCTHWHIMLFCRMELLENYKVRFRHYFERTSPNGNKHGCIFQDKRPTTSDKAADSASAASYVIKYIAKNFSVEADNSKIPENTNSHAIEAWKGAASIRCFSMFGVKGCITKYRDCRKIANRHHDAFAVINDEQKTLEDTSLADKVDNLITQHAKQFHVCKAVSRLAFNALLSNQNSDLLDEIASMEKQRKNIARSFTQVFRKESQVKRLPNESINDYLNRYHCLLKDYTKLLRLVSLSSAKNKRSKSGKYVVDFKQFMLIESAIEYDKERAQDRFGTPVNVNAAIRLAGTKAKIYL